MGVPPPDTVERTELPETEPSTAPETAPVNGRPVKHGYPPPRLSAGSVTTSYCGQPMVVEGEVTDQPPRDACPLCALAWRSRQKRVPWL